MNAQIPAHDEAAALRPLPKGESGDTPVTISETCRCGCSITVTMPTVPEARRQVDDWRAGHPCREPDWSSGAGAATVGFAAEPWPVRGHANLEVRAGELGGEVGP